MPDSVVTRDMIVEQARTWLGVKWRHQGRTRYGVDCAGLVIKVAHSLGLSKFDMFGYDRRGFQLSFVNVFREHMDEKSVNARETGDVLLFRDNLYPCHAAIVTCNRGTEYVIHSSPKKRGTTEERLAPLMPHVTHCFSFRGVI